jgi:predicted metal-dependent hydrolase
MPSVSYGKQTIAYRIQVQEGLKSHYISVEKGEGVILKGAAVSPEQADRLILKKARWILDKLELVRAIGVSDIVTGSRIPYLGRQYYVQLFEAKDRQQVEIDFTSSKFLVYVPPAMHTQEHLQAAFEAFMAQKAVEKLTPRVKKWAEKTGLDYEKLHFRKLEKRWGSCSPTNQIVLNTEAIKLPFSLIDYLIVHELIHTRIKNHSREFWAELSRHVPNWKELDAKMYGMKM